MGTSQRPGPVRCVSRREDGGRGGKGSSSCPRAAKGWGVTPSGMVVRPVDAAPRFLYGLSDGVLRSAAMVDARTTRQRWGLALVAAGVVVLVLTAPVAFAHERIASYGLAGSTAIDCGSVARPNSGDVLIDSGTDLRCSQARSSRRVWVIVMTVAAVALFVGGVELGRRERARSEVDIR